MIARLFLFLLAVATAHAVTLTGGTFATAPIGTLGSSANSLSRLVGSPLHSDWFDTDGPALWLRPASAGSTAQISDALYTSSGSGLYYQDQFWHYSIPAGQTTTVSRTTSDPSVIVPSSTDAFGWTFVAPGTATITLTSGDRTYSRVVTTAVVSGGAGTATFAGYAPDSLRYNIDHAVDDALAADAATWEGTLRTHWLDGYGYNSGTDTVNLPINPQLWTTHRWDFSSAVVASITNYTGWSIYGYGAAVSPRHVVLALHYLTTFGSSPGVGERVFFRGNDGVIYERTIEAAGSVLGDWGVYSTDGAHTLLSLKAETPDLMVYKLDSDLPAAVVPAKILPANWRQYLPSHGWPLVHYSGHGECNVLEETTSIAIGNNQARSAFLFDNNYPSTAPRARLWRATVPGDSGSPEYVVVNGEPVLVTVVSSNEGGAPIADYATEINAAMAALGGGYSLQVVDLSGFPTY